VPAAMAEAEAHVRNLEDKVAYLKQYGTRDGKLVCHIEEGALRWWRTELKHLTTERNKHLKRIGMPPLPIAN
jgi:hypothetical protein